MKWYWYVVIGVAVLVIGYFGYKMFKKDKATNGHSHSSTENGGGSATAPENGETPTENGGGEAMSVAV